MDRDQLGLATFHRPGMDLWSWIRLAEELELGALEIRADPGIAHPDELSPKERASIRALARNGLKISVHMPIHGVNLTCPSPRLSAASLGEVLRSVEFAGEIGADVVVIHPGTLPEEYVPFRKWRERAWELLRFSLSLLLSQAKRENIRLALENKQRARDLGLVGSLEEHLRVLSEFPDLWACLDVGHLHTFSRSPRDYISGLGKRLIHVHLHDNFGDHDAHLPLGEGNVPWEEALRALRENGFSGRVILEIPDPDGLRHSVEKVLGL